MRPHSALGYKTPMEFVASWKAGFYIAGLREEASNAGPLPQTPIPATLRGEQKNGGQVSEAHRIDQIAALPIGGRIKLDPSRHRHDADGYALVGYHDSASTGA